MEIDKITQHQFSHSVASAQTAKSLDALAASLQSGIVQFPLPTQIRNTGLTIQSDGTTHGLSVNAHGVSLKGRFDHIWLNKGQDIKPLGGRIRFFQQNNDGQDANCLYQIIFDSIGNARLGDESSFSYSIRPGSDELEEFQRKLALALINAIHKSMDLIECGQ